jgi:hypothetical protein
MATSISGSVGEGGKNKNADVITNTFAKLGNDC